MAEDVELPFPLGGRSDNPSFGAQPPGTTREAVNVRGIDPKTGRARGAQRPGSTKFTSAAISSGNKVQALASISYDRPKIKYSALDPSAFTAKWSALSAGQNEGVDVDTDRQGNVYLLDKSGVVEKYNSDGKLLRTIPLPTTVTDLVPRALSVDEDGAIYVLASDGQEVDGQSVVWRLRRPDGEDEFYEEHWSLQLPGSVPVLAVRLGLLVLVRDPEAGAVSPSMAAYTFLNTSEPVLAWERPVPNPCYGLHIDRHGSIFTSHPAAAGRVAGPTPAGFNPSVGISSDGRFHEATLHDVGLVKAPSTTNGDELPDNGDRSEVSRYRIHAMLMADHLDGYVDGDEVSLWPDHRWVLGQNPAPPNGSPGGNANNPLDYGIPAVDSEGKGIGGPTDNKPRRSLYTQLNQRPGPTYRATGAWRMPSVAFDPNTPSPGSVPGTGLASSLAFLSTVFKSDTDADGVPNADGTAEQALVADTLVPGHTVFSQGTEPDPWGNGWAISHLWRIPASTDISVLWWQKGEASGVGAAYWRTGRMALLANARFEGGAIVPDQGWVTFVSDHIGPINGSLGSEDSVGGGITNPTSLTVSGNAIRCVSQQIPTDIPNPQNMALITINHGGWNWDGSGGDSGMTNDSGIRINGVPGPYWSSYELVSAGPSTRTVVGHPNLQASPNSGLDLFYEYNNNASYPIQAFAGELCEWYTLLGRSTYASLNYGNNEGVRHPSVNGGTDGDSPPAGSFSGTILLGTDPYPAAGDDDAKAAWTVRTSRSPTDVELMEGVIAHKYAIADLLPDGTAMAGGLCEGHPFGTVARYPVGAGSLVSEIQTTSAQVLVSSRPILAKWGPIAGELKWALNGAGVGYGVTTDSDRGVLTVGAQDSDDDGVEPPGHGYDYRGAIARKVIDYGDTYSVSEDDGAWAHIAPRNLVPSDDSFSEWTPSSNSRKTDDGKTGPFDTGTAYYWHGAATGINTYIVHDLTAALGNGLVNNTDYTFSVYVRNKDATKTQVIAWDTADPSRETEAGLIITWTSATEGSTIASVSDQIDTGSEPETGTSSASYTSVGGGWYRIVCSFRFETAHGDDMRLEIQPSFDDTYSENGAYIWGPQLVASTSAQEFPPLPLLGYRYTKLKADADDNLYWPRGNRRTLDKFSGKDGSRLWSYKHGKSHLDAVRSVAFDPTVPLYDTDEFMMPQHLYLASVGGQSGTAPTAYTNLISAPEDVTGYGWGVQGDLTRQANTHQAPDGSFTADSITSPASAGATTDNLVVEWGALTPAVGAQYTYAGHVRKDFADNVQFIMYLIDATPDPSEIRQQVAYRINLTDGSTISLASNHNEGGPAYTEDDVSITLVEGHGDYWRVTITLTDYEGICERWRIRIYPYAQVEAHPARTLVVWGQQATAGGEAPPYGGDPGSEPTITKLQIVGEEQVIGESASARATRYLGIAGGDVVTMKQGAAAASVTGGSGALDAVAPHIATAVFRNKVYLTDGRTYKVYDAKDNKVEDFTSEDAGEIPKRGRLMVAWDNRLVIARTADSDHNWYMSKKGEPTKWDVFPPIWTVLDAVSGDSDRGPGQSPDIINALIPWSDDLLLMGGDHTIQRMTGNPLAGGQIDLVSDQTGISFGSPWAKDPEGVLYFFGSRGGVYAYAPGQQVQRITLNSIDRELQDVNLGTYRVGMAWSYREDGLYVFQLPFGTGGVEAKGWFFERKTGAWWDVEFSSTTLQPTALTVFDGDSPSDRIVAFGCEDGLVRYFDENAKDDDGTRIDSRVLIGPLAASQGLRSRFSSLQVTLASDQDGATAEWFASDAPDVLGEARIRRDLMPGLSPTVHRKVSGGYLWLKLHNGAVGERWAFEAARATVAPAGRTRVLR